jgi:uncharacterized protein (TIGR02588 family)
MTNRNRKRPPRSRAEWVTFSVATGIVTAIASLIVVAWITQRDTPADLTVQRVGPVRSVNGQFYVPFEVANRGGKTAESVQVIAELKVNNTLEEAGDLQIDFLSSQETAQGEFLFTRDPSQGELLLRVAGYKQP